HLARRPIVMRGERLAEEGLRCFDATIGAKQEVHGATLLVNRAIQVVPAFLHEDIGLINPPRTADRLGVLIPALFELWYKMLNPAIDCARSNADTPLS